MPESPLVCTYCAKPVAPGSPSALESLVRTACGLPGREAPLVSACERCSLLELRVLTECTAGIKSMRARNPSDAEVAELLTEIQHLVRELAAQQDAQPPAP